LYGGLVSRSQLAHHNLSTKKEPLEKCMVTALENSHGAPHRNCMVVGCHEEFCSARTNHNQLKMHGCATCAR
jgi:hypothetical protein